VQKSLEFLEDANIDKHQLEQVFKKKKKEKRKKKKKGYLAMLRELEK
jgi:hypothetical protein